MRRTGGCAVSASLFLYALLGAVFCMLLVTGLVSCADTHPETVSASCFVVFDYTDASRAASQRLCVFVQTKSAVQRTGAITVAHTKSSYEWQILEPVQFAYGTNQWAGSTVLLPRAGEPVLQGAYTVTYRNKLDEEVLESFSVLYPEALVQALPADMPSVLGKSAAQKIAVYAENEKLLYYGAAKNTWKTADDMWKEYGSAVKSRRCYEYRSSKNCTVICMLPPDYRSKTQF